MGAYTGLTSFFEGSLSDYAIKYGYDDSNILILEGDINRLQSDHLQIYQNLISCQHHSDRRTPIQYGQDLIASWIFEDFILDEMKNAPFSIELSGADRNRVILPNQKTSTASDYIITSNTGVKTLLELVNDYTGFWARNQKLHLRDNKYIKLQHNKSLLLAISLVDTNRQFTIFDFRKDIPAKYIPSHRPYGYKPAYELRIEKDKLLTFSIKNVITAISQII